MNGHENLQPVRSEAEAREKGRKGGIASGKARREKRTVRKILTELIEMDISKSPQFAEVAKKLGIENEKSIKELFVIVCLLNSIQKGELSDIEKLMELLGEATAENQGVLDDILKAVGGVESD